MGRIAKLARLLQVRQRPLQNTPLLCSIRLIMRLGLGGIGKEPVHLSRVDIGGQVDRLIMRLGLRN